MRKIETAVFDMDGTLYQFPGAGTFTQIPFGQTIGRNVERFIAQEFEMDETAARQKTAELAARFDGEMSLGLEREFGIDRMRFFDETWNLDPREFVVANTDLRSALESIDDVELRVLSAAPRIWVDRVLGFLGVADVFEDRIFTGEPDIRKPSPEAFRRALGVRAVDPSRSISIGDQEMTDILPARSIGMKTIRIAPKDTESSADFVAEDIMSAIELVKGES